MMEELLVNAYSVPVLHKPDVCIIGAGPSGVAAAIAASRQQMSVLLVEKYGFSGGATVAGLSGTICGLFSSSRNPEQIVFGFADEFYSALKKKGAVAKPVKFGQTLLVPHDSLQWKEVADQLLFANNCRLLYHTHFLKAFTNADHQIIALLMQGPEGQFAIRPKFVIDASGDAAVVHSVTGETFMGKDGVVQTPTMIFKMGNVNMPAFLAMDPSELSLQIAAANRSGEYVLPRTHVYVFPLPNTGEVLCNMTKITFSDGGVPSGIKSADITYAEVEGRKQAREYARFLMDRIGAFKNAHMVDTGVQIGIRQTRSIVGKEKLFNEDVIQARKNPNGITYSAWPMEIHSATAVTIVNLTDDYYDIPFETLIPRGATNFLVAGRCLSAEHEALASARVTAQCFGMGYAAGAACGLMRHEHLNAFELSGVMVKNWMKEQHLKCTNEA